MDRTHLGVYAVIDYQGMALCIRKIRGPYAGCFDLPGGTPDFGETHLETVTREIREETQCRMTLGESDFVCATSLVHAYACDGQEHRLHHHAIIYRMAADPSSVALCDGDGVDSGGSVWVSMGDGNLSPLAKHVFGLCKRP